MKKQFQDIVEGEVFFLGFNKKGRKYIRMLTSNGWMAFSDPYIKQISPARSVHTEHENTDLVVWK